MGVVGVVHVIRVIKLVGVGEPTDRGAQLCVVRHLEGRLVDRRCRQSLSTEEQSRTRLKRTNGSLGHILDLIVVLSSHIGNLLSLLIQVHVNLAIADIPVVSSRHWRLEVELYTAAHPRCAEALPRRRRAQQRLRKYLLRGFEQRELREFGGLRCRRIEGDRVCDAVREGCLVAEGLLDTDGGLDAMTQGLVRFCRVLSSSDLSRGGVLRGYVRTAIARRGVCRALPFPLTVIGTRCRFSCSKFLSRVALAGVFAW